ncbi:hypothetical protein [Pseudomonas poae]|uniref:Uncharacterized protein n=1 Tax=Pseudomonas poae TaxID=200451 RepID=A0A2S9EEZ5_9PSED|nr:hypothetical protein [Pseudomonas poae]PRA27254.1 hypothetical protein CQZ97_18200 [Pseudomonas poae]PRC13658.1 hypothetical protein CQZ99_21115 [Pseudomonas poae]
MLDILRGTPLWVYAVFFVVTYYDLLACFKNYQSKTSLRITPIVFVAFSLVSISPSHGVVVQILVCVLGLFIGSFLALRIYSYGNIKLEGEGLVIAGSIKVLAVYWCFFAWRYYIGYLAAMYPELAAEVSAKVLSSFGGGLINGLIVGRCLKLLSLFKADNNNAVVPK